MGFKLEDKLKGRKTDPLADASSSELTELEDELLKKYDKTVVTAMRALMLEEAERKALENNLEGSQGIKKFMKSALHSTKSLFTKNQVNEILRVQKPQLEAHARKILGVLPDAINALKDPEIQEVHALFKGSRFEDITNSPEFFGVLRYAKEKKIKIDEVIITSLSKNENIKSARDIFGKLAIGHHWNSRHPDNKLGIKFAAEEDPSVLKDFSDEQQLDENLAYTTYVAQYQTLDSMSKTTQKIDFSVKKNADGEEIGIEAQRRKHWKNLGATSVYIGAGMTTKLLVGSTFPVALIPIGAFTGSAVFAMHRALGKERTEKRTPARFNKQLFLAAAKVYKRQSKTLETSAEREKSKEEAETFLEFTKNPLPPEEVIKFMKNKASLNELEVFHATIGEYENEVKHDKKANPVYIGYINELKNIIFEEIFKKSKKQKSSRETILTLAHKNKDKEDLLSANIDELTKKEHGLTDDTMTSTMRNIDWKDTTWTITKSFGKSALFFGLGRAAGWGIGAAREYFGSHAAAAVEPFKAETSSTVHPPVTSTLTQITDTQTGGGNFQAGVSDTTSSVNHTPIAPELNPLLGEVADKATGKLAQNVKAVNDLLAQYADRTLTPAEIVEGKAKLQELYSTMTPAEKAELATELAKEQASTSLGQGPKGPWGVVGGVRKGLLHMADGKWGGPDNWLNGFGTDSLGIDMQNSMAFDDWYLYNNATNKGYGMIVKTLAGTVDVAKDTLYLGLTEPFEKFVRLQGHIWDVIGFPNSLSDFEVDVYTRKLLSAIMASGGGDAFDGATANEMSGMISSLKNDPENLKALLTFLAIAAVTGTFLYKKNKKAADDFWKSTKGFFGGIKKHATSKPAHIVGFLAAPSLYLWTRYPAKWTYNGIAGLFKKKADAGATGTPPPSTP